MNHSLPYRIWISQRIVFISTQDPAPDPAGSLIQIYETAESDL